MLLATDTYSQEVTDVDFTLNVNPSTDQLCVGEIWTLSSSHKTSGFGSGTKTVSWAWSLQTSPSHLILTDNNNGTATITLNPNASAYIQGAEGIELVVTVTEALSKGGTTSASSPFSSPPDWIPYLEDFSSEYSLTISPSDLVCPGTNIEVKCEHAGGFGWGWSTAVDDLSVTGPGINPSSTNLTTTVTANVAGTYEAEGFSMQPGGKCPITKSVQLNLKSTPIVSIEASKSELCTNETITLTGQGASTYTWSSSSPANGLSASAGSSVTATPTSSGVKIFTVTGVNQCNQQGASSISITVNEGPTALWDAPHFITFANQQTLNYINNLSTVPPIPIGTTNYYWDFSYAPGNPLPSTSPLANINNSTPLNHTYTSSGQKQILLEAVGPGPTFCSNTYQEHIYITEEISPNFTISTGTKCEGSATNLQNTSTLIYGGNMNIVYYEWDFGDGSSIITQTGLVPFTSHTYANAGIYTIKLTAYSGNMVSNKFIKTKQITISPNPYVSAFTTTGHCEGQTITFNDVTSSWHPAAPPFLHQWDWNNDNTVDESNWTNSTFDSRNHIFTTPGTKTVRLRRSYSTGCFSEVIQTITVDPTPVSVPTKNQSDICEDGEILISGSNSTISSGIIDDYEWNLTDGTYNAYRYGNSATAHTTSFSNTHVNMLDEMNPGLFTVTMTVTSGLGCSDAESITFNVWDNPDANFTNSTVCDLNDGATQFTNSTPAQAGATHTFAWDFDDGSSSSTNASPSHDFSSDGSYNVELTVQESIHGCSEIISKSVGVKPNPVADFTTSNNLCDNQDIVFTDASTILSGTLASWDWTWDDGSPTTNTSINYTNHSFTGTPPFTKNVNMKVTGSNNCFQNVSKPITISAKPMQPTLSIPVNSAGNTSPICFGESYQVNASSILGGENYSWYKNGTIMGGFTTSSISEDVTTWDAYSESSRDYEVRVTDANGCFNTSSIAAMDIIKLNTGFGFQGGQQNVLCPGESTVLTGVAPVPVQTYDWQLAAYDDATQTFSSTYNSVGTNSKTHTINNTAPGRYKFLTSNGIGTLTCTEESYTTIDVINAPPLTLNQTGTITIDPTNQLLLNHVAQTYPTYSNFAWYLNDKKISTNSTIVATIPGDYYLLADGDCGREKSNVVTVILDCNHAAYNMTFPGNQMFTTATTLSPGTLGGQAYIKVDGNWEISSNTLTLQDVVLIMDNCASITVQQNANLVATNTSIVGCADWEGITSNGGNVTLNNVNVTGAQVGVVMTNEGDYSITNSTFDNNYVHIGIDGVNSLTNVNTITTSSFGNVAINGSTCNNPIFANWTLTQRPLIYAINSSNMKIVSNDFSTSINNPTVEPIAIEMVGVNNAIIDDNTIYGWFETGVEVNGGDNHIIAQNDIEFGYDLNGITQAIYMTAAPTFPNNNGLYMSNSAGNSIAQNQFYNLNRGIEFYQVNTNPSTTNITKNKFQSNEIGILSSTNVDPTTAPPGLNTNNAVEIQVNCNNFVSNTYGWVGTGTYPNQGSTALNTGNVYSNNVQWDVVVERNSKTYHRHGTIGANQSLTLVKSPIQLDGITMIAGNTILFINIGTSPNCSGMRLKTDGQIDDNVVTEVGLIAPILYPNPFYEKVNIVANNTDSYSISVADLSGSQVYGADHMIGDTQIQLDGIRKGVYIVTITSGEQVHHYRIIKAN